MPEKSFEPKYKGQAFPEQAPEDLESKIDQGDQALVDLENEWGRRFSRIGKVEIPDGEGGTIEKPLGAEFEFFAQDGFPKKRDKDLGITMDEIEGEDGKTKKVPVVGEVNIPDNPGFEYAKLDKAQLEAQHEELLKLKGDVIESMDKKKEILRKRKELEAIDEGDIEEVAELEKLQVVRILYLQRINEDLARNRMLQATVDGDDKRFQKYSEFIYGKISPESFNNALDIKTQTNINLLDQARGELKDKNPEIAAEIEKAATEALELMRDKFDVDIDKFKPKKIETVPVEGEAVSGELITKALKPALDKINSRTRELLGNSDFQGINIVYDENRGNAAVVMQSDEQGEFSGTDLFLPKSSKRIENRNAEGPAWVKTIAHEVDSHYARKLGGHLSGYHIIAGADRAWTTEEGLATYAEQKHSVVMDTPPEDRQPGGAGAVPGMIAIGMSTQKNMNFRELYEATRTINKPLALKQAMKAGRSNEEVKAWAEASCRRVAYFRAFRTKRGTSGETGGTYTKDHMYYEGNKQILDIIKTQGEKALVRLRVGLISPEHLRYTAMLGLQEPEMGDQLFEDNIIDLVEAEKARQAKETE